MNIVLAPLQNLQNGATVQDFISLLKPRVMSLVVFTAACGLFMAPGHLHPLLVFTAILCIACGAGAAGCLNMWWERDLDAIMARTRNRPLPSGKIAPDSALAFGIILSFASVIVMGIAINWLASGLLALTIFFYVFIYTMILKRITPQNIVIGGASGAFPPLIGWVCVTGTPSLEAALLFGIIFLWTPPHFWALCLYNHDDYKAAGVPMMPVTAGIEATKKQIVLYPSLLVVCSLLPAITGMTSWVYGRFAIFLGSVFIILALRIYQSDEPKISLHLFGYSIFYLFALFLVMTIDRLVAGFYTG